MHSTKKSILIFLLCCLPLSNILWYIAYSAADEYLSTSLIVLTSFLPALIALVLCRVEKVKWDSLMILPNIKKAWKVYLIAIFGALFMVYINELFVYLMFMGKITLSEKAFTLYGLTEVFVMTLLGIVSSIEMLGEELGWLGWLFPKLEKLYGTRTSILLLALIRTTWHLGILICLPHPLIGTVDLFLSNLLSQAFLVYITKKSSSLFPAAVVHAVTNLLPTFATYNESFYQNNIIPINCVGLASAAIVGGISYLMMRKEKMFVKAKQTQSENNQC